MKKCSYCGRENSDKAVLCQECGTEFAEKTSAQPDELGNAIPVTIFSTFNAPEAQFIRSRLEAANFHPFVANENVAQWLAGLSTATLILIQVPESEAADAKEFLPAPDLPAE